MRLPIGEMDPEEPTPWATGLTITVVLAAVVAAIDVIISNALANSFDWLWIPANALIGIGLAPSLWLLHQKRFWRWIAYGISLGLVLAWIGLSLNALLRPELVG